VELVWQVRLHQKWIVASTVPELTPIRTKPKRWGCETISD
jgi:hypothetical protein